VRDRGLDGDLGGDDGAATADGNEDTCPDEDDIAAAESTPDPFRAHVIVSPGVLGGGVHETHATNTGISKNWGLLGGEAGLHESDEETEDLDPFVPVGVLHDETGDNREEAETNCKDVEEVVVVGVLQQIVSNTRAAIAFDS
jgi:hypothetical protein